MPMASNELVLGLVQMRCGTDPAANMEKAVSQIHAAAKKGAQIVCLPELFLSPYFCNTHDQKLFDLAEPIPGPRTERLSKAAKDAGAVVVASLFEQRMVGMCHNTAVVLGGLGEALGPGAGVQGLQHP